MKSPDSNENAVAGMENWIATLRVRNGYGGPSIGPDGDSLSYCGTAFDWRYEGFLDGCAALYRATGQADYLDRIERDLRAICSAQLLNGTFRNSWFDQNPYEGGMPYEPALLAAACRARTVLTESGRSAPAEFDRALELFVETRLLNELWNRLLHTFNDWLQSRFEYYTPHAVAAAIELLMDYADLTEDWPRLKPYVIGAADSLLTLQCSSGSLSGGIPLSNQRGSAFSPAMAARCAPALIKAADKTGQEKYRQAAVALADLHSWSSMTGLSGSSRSSPELLPISSIPSNGPACFSRMIQSILKRFLPGNRWKPGLLFLPSDLPIRPGGRLCPTGATSCPAAAGRIKSTAFSPGSTTGGRGHSNLQKSAGRFVFGADAANTSKTKTSCAF
jgi:hypothetical protein